MAVDANKAFQAVKDVTTVIAQGAKWIVGFLFIVMLAVIALQAYGWTVPLAPSAMAHEPMLYYAGAYWLMSQVFR